MTRFLKDNLEDYLQDRLSERDRIEFESQMAKNPVDRDAIQQMQRISASFRAFDLPEDARIGPRVGFFAGVIGKVEEQRQPPFWNFLLEPLVMRRVAYASCAWLILLASANLYRSSAQTPTPYQPSSLISNYFPTPAQSSSMTYAQMILCSSPESEAYCNVRLGADLDTNRSLMLAAVMVSGSPGR